MDYTLSAAIIKRNLGLSSQLIHQTVSVPPKSKVTLDASLTVPQETQTGIYQGFLSFQTVITL